METRTEILGLLTELLLEDVSLTEMASGHEAIQNYRSIIETDEADEEDLDDVIPEVIEGFFAKEKALEDEIKSKERQANLKAKESLIEELRALIQDEENIGKAFNTFNELREKWNSVGDIPRDQYSRIQTEFSRLQESFYYTINIYKELADHDKKVNLKKKRALVEKLKSFEQEKNVQILDKELKKVIKQWDDIGATFQSEWEAVKDEFWTEARKVMARVNEYYEVIRARHSENLEKKKILIKQVQDIAGKERAKTKEWSDSTEKILGIQADWKKIGFSKENEEVWSEFREACDLFFQAKKAHFDKLGEVFDDRKAKKEELIAKAAKLSESTDWKNASQDLIQLQKEWKEVGPASQRDENKLWKKFRSHCDSFFNARNRNFKEREKEEKENLKVKEDIISRIKAFSLTGNRSTDLGTLKEFSNEWNVIGHVPFKQKDKIYKAYKEALNEHYGSMRLDEQEKKNIAVQEKLDSLKNDPRSIKKEKDHLRRQIDKLNVEIKQYENNLGFFNDPTGNSPLVKEVEKKIDRNKTRIVELKELLKKVNSVSA